MSSFYVTQCIWIKNKSNCILLYLLLLLLYLILETFWLLSSLVLFIFVVIVIITTGTVALLTKYVMYVVLVHVCVSLLCTLKQPLVTSTPKSSSENLHSRKFPLSGWRNSETASLTGSVFPFWVIFFSSILAFRVWGFWVLVIYILITCLGVSVLFVLGAYVIFIFVIVICL